MYMHKIFWVVLFVNQKSQLFIKDIEQIIHIHQSEMREIYLWALKCFKAMLLKLMFYRGLCTCSFCKSTHTHRDFVYIIKVSVYIPGWIWRKMNMSQVVLDIEIMKDR